MVIPNQIFRVDTEKSYFIMRVIKYDTSEDKMYIYQITNLINNKIYIGKTNNPQKRWDNHKCSNDPNMVIARALRKYGINNFKFEVLYRNISIEDIDDTIHCLTHFKNLKYLKNTKEIINYIKRLPEKEIKQIENYANKFSYIIKWMLCKSYWR